jgi:hypothetical protein
MHAVRRLVAVATLAFGAVPSCFCPTAALAQARPTAAPVSAADLRVRLYGFADDSMGGRASGTEGQVKATAYLAAEAERIGLKPAGDRGTWFQELPLVSRGFTAGGGLVVGARRFAFGEDFGATIARDAVAMLPATATVIDGGELGDSASYPKKKLVEGRVVVLRPSRRTVSFSTRSLQVGERSHFAGAAAVVVAGWDRLTPAARRPLINPVLNLRANTSQLPPTFVASREMADALLRQAGGTVAIDLRFAELAAPARNVVAVLPGGDPALRGEYVVVAAHSDHDPVASRAVDHDSLRAMAFLRRDLAASMPRGERPSPRQYAALRVDMDSLRALGPPRLDSIRNGADDDGSGAVAVLEIAEALAASPMRPRRSVLFIWHAAEELGLWGSDWFTEHPTVDLDAIVAQLNLDMVGRGGVRDIVDGGPRYLQVIGASRATPRLAELIDRLNDRLKAPFAFDRSFDADGHRDNMFCRSDQAKYARFGIPVAFFTTGMHPDYHQVTDEPQYIDYDKLAAVTSFVRDVAVAIADRDDRLRSRGTRRDPEARCRQ